MPKLASPEWIKAAQTIINMSVDFKQASRNWEGDFIFSITKDQNLDEDFNFYFEVIRGECKNAKKLDKIEECTCLLSGPYSIWKKVLSYEPPSKETNFLAYVIEDKMKLSGDMSLIMRNISLIKIITHALSLIKKDI